MQRLIAELRNSGIVDENVLAAIAAVDRERFVSTPFVERAWENTALPIAFGQTISQPLVVAAMTEALRVGPRMKVLEVGTGSGYQAAVLAEIVKQVYTIEIVEALGRTAESRLAALGYKNIEVRIGDGYKGWPEKAPFDGIVVTAAAPRVPQALVDQLKPGGRMIVAFGNINTQELRRLTRGLDNKVVDERLLPVKLGPLLKQAPKE